MNGTEFSDCLPVPVETDGRIGLQHDAIRVLSGVDASVRDLELGDDAVHPRLALVGGVVVHTVMVME